MRTLVLVAAVALAAYRLLVRGALTLDLGLGRTVQPLGPLTWRIEAPRELVFEVLAGPYRRTPRAMAEKLEVWERGSDMVLAAHHTPVGRGRTTTLETVRFEEPARIDFRLVRGPVPHVTESFVLRADGGATELTWEGELGADGWALGRWWGSQVAAVWTRTVRASIEDARAEAERRASR